MRVTVNGEQREISSASVDALLGELDYEGTHFAIALNYDVVPKGRWAETQLQGRRRDRDHHAAAGRVRMRGTQRATHSLSSPRTRGPITTGARVAEDVSQCAQREITRYGSRRSPGRRGLKQC